MKKNIDNDSAFNEEKGFAPVSIEEQIRRIVADRSWSTQLKIALSGRKLAIEGHAQTLAGHISVRAENSTFWTNQLLGGFANLTKSTVVRLNDNLDVVEGDGIPNPAVRFHLWVYKARPDINAIVHTHPPYTSALAMTGKKLAVAHMDAAMFYNDCAFLPEWPGVPLADEEGKLISEALGDKKSLLLANHGLLTTGENVETAVYLAIQFERAARLQLLAESVGEIKAVKDQHASAAHDFLLSEVVVIGQFYSWPERILREQPDVTD